MKIVLHLGAHKTASTYLQRHLEREAPLLAAHGIAFQHPRTLRPQLAEAGRGPLHKLLLGRNDRLTNVLSRFIEDAEVAEAERLVISEENLIGSLRENLLNGQLYADATDELAAVGRALGDRPVHALVAIREYADFFASAYGQMLRGWKYLPFDDVLKRRLLTTPRGWPDLLSDVQQALPAGSTLRVWRYEELSAVEPAIDALLIGKVAAGMLAPFRQRPAQGPSQAAVDRLTELATNGSRPDRATVCEVLRKFEKRHGHPAFDPWSAAERHHLQQRYLRDIALIRARWPGILIEEKLAADGTSWPQSGVSI